MGDEWDKVMYDTHLALKILGAALLLGAMAFSQPGERFQISQQDVGIGVGIGFGSGWGYPYGYGSPWWGGYYGDRWDRGGSYAGVGLSTHRRGWRYRDRPVFYTPPPTPATYHDGQTLWKTDDLYRDGGFTQQAPPLPAQSTP